MQERLRNALLEAVKAKLRGRNLVCGICGGTRWQIIGITNIPFNMNLTGSVVIGGPHIPMAIMCCENCGSTIQFNMVALLGSVEHYENLKMECKTDSLIEQATKNE